VHTAHLLAVVLLLVAHGVCLANGNGSVMLACLLGAQTGNCTHWLAITVSARRLAH